MCYSECGCTDNSAPVITFEDEQGNDIEWGDYGDMYDIVGVSLYSTYNGDRRVEFTVRPRKSCGCGI